MPAAQTQIAAYYSHVVGSHSAGQRADIIDFISRNRGDWSIGELSKAMGLQKSTLSARVNELLHSGELVEAPKRKDSCSGITIRPVRLPLKQLELL